MLRVSIRYYIYSFIIVFTLTVLISWIKQVKTRKEFFRIMLYVTLGFVGVIGLWVGLMQLLVVLGIAESGLFL